MTAEERTILETLDALLRPPRIRALIDSRMKLAEAKLAADRRGALSWEPLPLKWYGNQLPPIIRSSWVFILRAGTATGAERHPNSHQRMMSYRGGGDFQTRPGDEWQSNLLVSDVMAPLENRWISIPPYVWHQAVVPAENGHWAVVSFHTAEVTELIEERPEPADWNSTRQRKYENAKTAEQDTVGRE